MRAREKLTVEEKISIALDVIKRERSLDEIRRYYRVSHTTVYKIRNAFLEGGKRALGGVDKPARDLEARVHALEQRVAFDTTVTRQPARRGPRASKAARGSMKTRVR
jgi:transposase-like protein